jgi:diguanylate cyclase (GGDEF)-like protein/PAS domain S-box-containing protein
VWLDLVLPVSAAALFALGQAAWRVRTTAVGRAFVALVVWAGSAGLLGLAADADGESRGWVQRLLPIATACASAAVLRLGLLAIQPSRRLPILLEAGILLPAIGVGAFGGPFGLAAWIVAVQTLTAYGLRSLPRRSWQSFDGALRVIRIATLATATLSCLALVTSSGSTATIVPGFAHLGLAVVLYYALPRLGLLAQDRVQHRSVLEAMSDGVLVVDLDDRLLEVNQAAKEILEIQGDDVALQPLAGVLAHHPDLVELCRGAIEGHTVYAPRPASGNGERRTYDLRLSALNDAHGAIQSRVLVLRDISDRIEIEEENRRQTRHVRLVHEVSSTVHDAPTIEHGLDASLALIASTMEFPVGHFLRSVETEEGSQLVASGLVYCGPGLVPDETSSDLEPGRPPDRDAIRSAFSKDVVAFDPRGLHWWKSIGVEMVCTIPVVISTRLHGVFELFDLPGHPLSETTGDMLEHLGGIVGQAIEKRLAEERVRRFAYRDDLTGLPNRQHFHQLLRAAVSLAARSERRMALLFLDLDGFKKVNDTLGHEIGDKLLAEVACRFSKAVRASDHLGRPNETGGDSSSSISRLGGDEFTVLLSEIQQPIDASLVADRLLATLETPITLAGQDLFMSTSIGIAVFPEDGEDAEALIRNADAAMYFAKVRGRNGYSFYSSEMNRSQSHRLELESRLRIALEREQLEIHYQPILSAETGRVVAAEALVRWNEPEWGYVPPDDFIPVAEETGLIVGLGQWVFRKVCEQARIWRDDCEAVIRIGVNVSGKQIREPGMVEMVRQALQATGIAPTQIELEITESTIMQDDVLTVQTLRQLKEMGVGLALDDFGTGYSSLSYLRRFTIDRVKIDRTFISELPGNASDAALTSAIIAMAHGLQLDVVAEGVETEAQARFLELRGCDELQGYLYGRPCPAVEFVDRLRARPRLASEDKPDERID